PFSLFFLIIFPPPPSPLFPYTTLFRSQSSAFHWQNLMLHLANAIMVFWIIRVLVARRTPSSVPNDEWITCGYATLAALFWAIHRSEEHTSELQSRFDLVCRLLLEKKNY